MSCHSFTPLSLKPPINQENSNDKNKSSRDRNFFKLTRKMHHWINENHTKPWIAEFVLTPHLPPTQKENFVRIQSNTQVELIFQHDTIPNPEKALVSTNPPPVFIISEEKKSTLISYSKLHAANESYHEQLQWHQLGKAE
ncbi:hypothetical protein V8G54_030235 [Vigna mungo]|uniref:Uncharacterized protein n=1 Tax=Vigna mungo TaxID=3915 RepID=A0AAQ3MWN7_VIGMU